MFASLNIDRKISGVGFQPALNNWFRGSALEPTALRALLVCTRYEKPFSLSADDRGERSKNPFAQETIRMCRLTSQTPQDSSTRALSSGPTRGHFVPGQSPGTSKLIKKQARSLFHVVAMLCFVFVATNDLFAQNSSLFHRPAAQFVQASGLGTTGEVLPAPFNSNVAIPPSGTPQFQSGYFPPPMENAGQLGMQTSWSYVPPVPARSLKLHDIVQIRIDEVSTSLATGNATSRKTTSYDATLKDWIRLVGLDTIKPAPQADGDPRVQTNETEVYRGDSTIRTSEAFTRNIAAEIVDIKPNGHIVLDATKDITENDNSWRYSLTGTCRSQDIGPDNVVLSRNLIHSKIDKQDLGHVRDGYSRGWLTKLLSRIKPF